MHQISFRGKNIASHCYDWSSLFLWIMQKMLLLCWTNYICKTTPTNLMLLICSNLIQTTDSSNIPTDNFFHLRSFSRKSRTTFTLIEFPNDRIASGPQVFQFVLKIFLLHQLAPIHLVDDCINCFLK